MGKKRIVMRLDCIGLMNNLSNNHMQISLISLFALISFHGICQDKALVDGQGCIRTKPSYSGEAVEFLKSGDTIVVLQQYEANNFYKVEYSSGRKRKVGYLAAHFLKFPSSVPVV